jgi:hypothetical protein
MGLSSWITGTALGKFFDWMNTREKNKGKPKASDKIRDIMQIELILKTLVESDMSIDCCLLMMMHNGGRKLMPHGFKYRSVIEGEYNEMQMKNFKKGDYQYLPLDTEYKEIILKIKEYGVYSSDVETMPESPLKSKFIYEKLQFVQYRFLHENEDELWYLLVGTTDRNERFDSHSQKHRILIETSKIKRIIQKY